MASASGIIILVVLFAANTSCYTLTQGSSDIRYSYYQDTLYVSSFSDILPEHLAPNLIIRHDSLLFDADSIILRDTRNTALDELLALLYSNERLTIEIIGNTSMAPGAYDEYANVIADSRARYVRDFLVDNQIDPGRVLISSYDNEAIDQDAYKHGDKQRRFVDIQIIEH